MTGLAACAGEAHVLVAPAKLTVSLRVTGVRLDGYHLLESEMVSLDLADTLVLSPGDHLTVDLRPPTADAEAGDLAAPGWIARPVGAGADNLVARALAATGRRARVQLTKRIPPGAGLGGGSSDAAAILRWAGRTEVALAAGLGADVPFCLAGGRGLVRGIGEELEPLPVEDRSYVLLLLPFGVDTAAVYRAWDHLVDTGKIPPPWPAGGVPAHGMEADGVVNDLEVPALAVEPRLAPWRRVFEEVTGRTVRMAGSGSTFFVEGTPEEVGLAGRRVLTLGGEVALVVPVRTSGTIGSG